MTAVVTSLVIPGGGHLADHTRGAASLAWRSLPALPWRPEWSPRPDECLYGDWVG